MSSITPTPTSRRDKPKSPSTQKQQQQQQQQQALTSSTLTLKSPTPKKRYSKTKLGCKTCKVRKIRCDETSPVCNNCTKSGRRCDGVSEPATRPGRLTFTAPLTLTHFRPTQTGWLTRREVALLDLFRHELVYSIVGHVGPPAWKRLILQAVHQEVALCHAVVAFGALSASRPRSSSKAGRRPSSSSCFLSSSSSSPSARAPPPCPSSSTENEFALRHYGKAIEAMRHVFCHSDKRSINTALLCTLVCICFELRIEEPIVAMMHLEHGLQVVNSNLHAVDEAITRAFARLDLQAAIFLGLRLPVLDPTLVASRIFVFDSVYQEADHALAGLTSRVWTFIRTVANEYRYREDVLGADERGLGLVPESAAAQAQSKIRNDLAEFAHLYLQPGGGGKVDRMLPEQISLLRIKHLTSVVVMSTCLSRDETAYDAHAADFVELVDLAADVRRHQRRLMPSRHDDSEMGSDDDGAGGASFQLDMSVVHPLYLTATKCRCPVTRRRAIRGLYAGPDFEGTWEAVVSGRIAERVVEMEERDAVYCLGEMREGQLLDVPERARIHSVDVDTDPAERRATLYFSLRPDGPGSGWCDLEEEMTW